MASLPHTQPHTAQGRGAGLRSIVAILAALTGAGLVLPADLGAQASPINLTVDTGEATMVRSVTDPATGISHDIERRFPHQISDDIYGMAFTTDAMREELDLALHRWGGNSTERYNHDTASTNLGLDWFFTNAQEQADHDDFISANLADGTASLITVPSLGWISKDGDPSCSFPTSDWFGPGTNQGPQDAEIEHWLDPSLTCGNGFVDGQFIRDADPTLTSVAVDELWAADWIQELVDTYGTAEQGGVQIFAVGNEPNLWEGTHGDVHPEPTTRSEIIDNNISYAQAIKDIDPTADVVGPVLFGGYSYYVSSAEILNGARPGDVANFTTEYLQAMADAEAASGQRLIDRFAVHFYDDRVYQGGTDEMRLQAPRSLWDSSYAPQDWWVIRDFTMGEGHALIPRLQGQINRNYPETDLAITEYNFGGGETLAGGLAQIDALGVFGREGLDAATIWDPYGDWIGLTEAEYNNRPLMWAFRMYRNYDGQGATFGDRSIYASSSDDSAVSIYAAERTTDGAITLMVLNKSNNPTEVAIDGLGPSAATGFRYSTTDLGAIETLGTVSVSGELSLPARSATLLVIDGQAGGDRTAPFSPREQHWAKWCGRAVGRLGIFAER